MKDWGIAYYNRLREFYDVPDRLSLLEYIIQYAEMETLVLGKKLKDKNFLVEKISIKAYNTLKQLYESCVKQLYINAPLPIITIPSEQEILFDIQKKYYSNKKKIDEE